MRKVIQRTLQITSLMLGVLTTGTVYSLEPPKIPDGVEFQVIKPEVGKRTQLFGAGALKYHGGVAFQFADPKMGYFSGLHVSDSGRQVFAVGRNTVFQAQLQYTASGRLTGLQEHSISVLKHTSGRALENAEESDAEALYFDGAAFYVGFEGINRVRRYSSLDAVPQAIELAPEFTSDTPPSVGYSSVTGHDDGTLLVFSERGLNASGDTKGWIWKNGVEGDGGEPISLRFDEQWFVVDMDFTPSGNLLVLEVAMGKSRSGRKPYPDNNRISIVPAASIVAGSVLNPEPIATLKPRQFYQKIEAIHARPADNGKTLIYLMSDSGRRWHTHLLMFEYDDR